MINVSSGLPVGVKRILQDTTDSKVGQVGPLIVPTGVDTAPVQLAKLLHGFNEALSQTIYDASPKDRKYINESIKAAFTALDKSGFHLVDSGLYNCEGHQVLKLQEQNDPKVNKWTLEGADHSGDIQATVDGLVEYIGFAKLAHVFEAIAEKSRKNFVTPALKEISKALNSTGKNAEFLYSFLMQHLGLKDLYPVAIGKHCVVALHFTTSGGLTLQLVA